MKQTPSPDMGLHEAKRRRLDISKIIKRLIEILVCVCVCVCVSLCKDQRRCLSLTLLLKAGPESKFSESVAMALY